MTILYDSTFDDIKIIFRKLRDNGGNVDIAELSLILSPSRARTSIRNLKNLGLIIRDKNEYKMTEIGKQYLFSIKNEKKKILFLSLNSLKPYHAFFEKIKYEKVEDLEIDYIQNIWGLLAINVKKRVLLSSFPLLCAILQELGLGEDKRGSFRFFNNYLEILKNLSQKNYDYTNYKNIETQNKNSKIEKIENKAGGLPIMNNLNIVINSEMSIEQIKLIFDRIESLALIINKNTGEIKNGSKKISLHT